MLWIFPVMQSPTHSRAKHRPYWVHVKANSQKAKGMIFYLTIISEKETIPRKSYFENVVGFHPKKDKPSASCLLFYLLVVQV